LKLTVLYFAAVRDLAHVEQEVLELPPFVTTVALLAVHLVAIHPSLEGRLGSVRFARNECFATMTDTVEDGDTIALIPPVTGG
jgi:sulfur-carrier protein